ncbi:nucleotidyltransferase [Caldithrix abyssi]|nr:nucleotidyltransferase [Caldithrix abyssi]
MSQKWENKLTNWTKPPSDTEENKLTTAENMIRDAIKAHPSLVNKTIEIFGQGSYANNTNVRLNSDIDICVRLMDTFYYDLPEGKTKEDFNIGPGTNNYSDFKNDVEFALVNKFDRNDVHRGNKAITIKGNSYRVEADVVPTFEQRRYSANGSYLSGTRFYPDRGSVMKNWPKQHIENGINKNTNTQRRFKKTVRIVKKLRYEMKDDGYSICMKVPSFLIECLVWNISNRILNNSTSWYDRVKQSVIFLYNSTMTEETCSEWGEVSELLYLFKGHSKWTRQDVNDFLVQAWNYIGYSND